MKTNLSFIIWIDILDNIVLPNLWQKQSEGLFLFEHENDPVHLTRTIKKGFLSWLWKKLTRLHRALISIPSNESSKELRWRL